VPRFYAASSLAALFFSLIAFTEVKNGVIDGQWPNRRRDSIRAREADA
jgi:hypothetical protein